MKIQDFRELEVWQVAMELVTMIYQHTTQFPPAERYGLTSQLRRAAVSVPSNIAEGHGRRSTKEFLNHLSMARGSLMEIQTQVEIATRLKLVQAETGQQLTETAIRVAQMINALMNALERRLENS